MNGSKGDTGSEFCVFENNSNIYSWHSRLVHENSVFQTEHFAIKRASLWAKSSTGKIF